MFEECSVQEVSRVPVPRYFSDSMTDGFILLRMTNRVCARFRPFLVDPLPLALAI